MDLSNPKKARRTANRALPLPQKTMNALKWMELRTWHLLLEVFGMLRVWDRDLQQNGAQDLAPEQALRLALLHPAREVADPATGLLQLPQLDILGIVQPFGSLCKCHRATVSTLCSLSAERHMDDPCKSLQ